VHIRGHEIALNPLINGVSFWENTHAVFSAGLSPEIVEAANVMTGGFPAEYGNRFGGVVDIVTKSGLRMTERGSVAFSGGNARRRQLVADVGGRRGAFGYYLFGGTFDSDRFLSPPDPRAIHDSARGGHFFTRLDSTRQRAGSFSAIVMADGTNLEIPNTPIDVELRPLAQADQRTRQQTATLGWTRAWSDSTVVNASAYERWSRLRLLPARGPLTAQADLTRQLTTLGGKVDLTRLLGRHTFKFGVDAVNLRPEEDLFYNYDGYRAIAHVLGLPHIHITGQVIQFSGSDSGGQVSAYAQDNLQLGRRITLDAGLRLDRYSLVIEDTHLSPRLNLAVSCRLQSRACCRAAPA
jgi:outer membrane receptor protein involved in Fe transport